ncbi:hypothetical protein GS913_06550 [Rhodococcus hoagii]|nr:hypothetical protein [Prescottella equi]
MHYAETQRSLDRERDYQTVRRDKPDGLWVSILGEDDWPSWCRENEFREHTLEVAHEVRLAADANVLLVNGPREFDEFDAKYRTADSRKFNEFIDWPRVESEYDGIIIAPYLWSRRSSAFWYYGWDCASGVIWNLCAIESFLPVSEAVTA